jgi:hypothetical protein
MTLSLSGQDADLFSTSITTAPVVDGSFSDSVEITYMPLAKGSHMATLTVSGGGAADATVALTAYGIDLPELQASLDTLSFGDVKVGTDSVAKFTLTAANVREDVLMTVSNPYKISSDNVSFSNSLTINRFNDNMDVYVKYSPTVVGVADTFVLISTGGVNIQVLVIGNAYTPDLIAEPSSLNFFSVYVGNSSTRSVNLTGSFLSDSVDFVVSAPFSLSGSSEDTIFSSTLRLAPFNGEQLLYVKYSPTTEGAHSGNVTISSGTIFTSIFVLGEGTNVLPSIVTNVALLNFGEVALGDSAIRSITLTLASISENLELKVNHPYSVSSDSINYDSILNVFPGTGDMTFYVKYKPAEEGVNISSMVINCGNVPSIRIPLYATSVDEGGATGVYDNAADGLMIYPNPFVDQLKVSGLVEISRIEFISITGRVIKVVINPSDIINTSALPAGAYVMRVEFSNGKQVARILLKR